MFVLRVWQQYPTLWPSCIGIDPPATSLEDELARIEGRAAHVDRLERDREALLNHYSRIVPEHLDGLEPVERNRIYKILDLTVLAHENGSLELKWTLGADLCRNNEPLPRWSSASTTPAFRFRAVLTGDGSEEVELART